MGYTHYWQQPDLTSEQMTAISKSVRKIIKEASGKPGLHNYDGSTTVPLVIRGGNGEGEPVATQYRICFNGDGDLSHETFFIEPQARSEFCKTAQKPYDVVVVACLTFLSVDYGFEVSSDGDMEDWEAGVELAEKALGRKFANPMLVEAMVR